MRLFKNACLGQEACYYAWSNVIYPATLTLFNPTVIIYYKTLAFSIIWKLNIFNSTLINKEILISNIIHV